MAIIFLKTKQNKYLKSSKDRTMGSDVMAVSMPVSNLRAVTMSSKVHLGGLTGM